MTISEHFEQYRKRIELRVSLRTNMKDHPFKRIRCGVYRHTSRDITLFFNCTNFTILDRDSGTRTDYETINQALQACRLAPTKQ